MKTALDASERAIRMIRKSGGLIRTRDAIALGIHSRILRKMVKEGKLNQISRGVYRTTESRPISNPDLFIAATRVPKGIICLISALAFHNITTQIPHKIYIALEKTSETPRLEYPPLSIHRFTGKAYLEGIEKHMMDRVEIKVYNIEKTLADCFKFRNQIGMDVVLEALKLYKSRKKFNIRAITHYAKICRVEKVMKPYLEALI